MTIANRSKSTTGARSQRAINLAAKKQLHKNTRAIDMMLAREAMSGCIAPHMDVLSTVIPPHQVVHEMTNEWGCDHTPGELVRESGMELVAYSYTEQEDDGFVWPVEHVFICRDYGLLSNIIPVTYRGNKLAHRATRSELLCNTGRATLCIVQELA